MTRPARIAIAVLAIVCGGLVVALVFALRDGDGYARLEETNARLLVQIGKVTVERDRALAIVEEAKQKAEAQKATIEGQAKTVRILRSKLRKPPPEAEPWAGERDAVIAAQELQIDTQALHIKTCWTAEKGCQDALEQQVAISLLEKERADTCIDYSRKARKREKWKLAGVAIGGVAAGTGVGFGLAQLQ